MLESISPFVAIAGGLLIGTAATLLLVSTGRIAGVSGMIAAAAGIHSVDPHIDHGGAVLEPFSSDCSRATDRRDDDVRFSADRR